MSALSESSVALRIATLRTEDVGNYTCMAENSVGSDSVTAPLVVHGNNAFLHEIRGGEGLRITFPMASRASGVAKA